AELEEVVRADHGEDRLRLAAHRAELDVAAGLPDLDQVREERPDPDRGDVAQLGAVDDDLDPPLLEQAPDRLVELVHGPLVDEAAQVEGDDAPGELALAHVDLDHGGRLYA